MKFLPGIEDERPVHSMNFRKVPPCLWAWFGNGDDFTSVWFVQCVCRIILLGISTSIIWRVQVKVTDPAALSTSNHNEGDWEVDSRISLRPDLRVFNDRHG